jgi:hypothetical protein
VGSASQILVSIFASTLLVICIAGCGDDRPPAGVRDGGPPACVGATPGIICIGETAVTCGAGGVEEGREDCARSGEICARPMGCSLCVPNVSRCDAETVETCNAEGTAVTRGETCTGSLHCSPAGCRDLCAEAEAAESYIGCEYWPVTTRNSQLSEEFPFAVVIANASLVPAEVVVDRAGAQVTRATVAPGGVETLTLPWVAPLRVPAMGGSVLVPDGAYHLTSDVPVTVYQFNPLDYRRNSDCAVEPDDMLGDGECFSFTNDASLLLPSHVLTGSYIAVARPTHLIRVQGMAGATPGFVAIVGTAEAPVTVEITASANIVASEDGQVPTMAPGMTRSFTLGRGDVLQLASNVPSGDCPSGWVTEPGFAVEYCLLGPEYDLTGTEIRATGPVAVIGGHDCTFVPFNRWACDHLEEAIFPVEALGTEVIVSPTQALRAEPNLLRVVSAGAGNDITFEPAIVGPTTLRRGEYIEVELSEPVRVTGSQPILVAQYLVGQDYGGIGMALPQSNGDPSMALAIPTEQFRSSYTFLAPETYETSLVNIIAPTGATVVLDGALLGGFEPIGGTVMSTTSQRIRGGAHAIEGTAPFGILVYGFGSYTSYFYPGGLDLRRISPPI